MNWRTPLLAITLPLVLGNTVSYFKTTHDLLGGDSRERIEESSLFEGSTPYNVLIDTPFFYSGRHAAYYLEDLFS